MFEIEVPDLLEGIVKDPFYSVHYLARFMVFLHLKA